jgi:beta-glucosidase-like glycosyl hydrolase
MKLPRANHLSPEELAGQLVMPAIHLGFMNRESPQARNVLQMVRKYQVGGFILSGGHPADVRYWTDILQRESKFPLFFAAELEQGLGFTFSYGTKFPHLLCFGAAGDTELVREYAEVVAKEARAVGINLIFAPPLNLACESENSFIITDAFHHSAEVVAQMSTIFIKQVQKYGIACAGKYLPIDNTSQSTSNLQQFFIQSQDTDLDPFSEAVKNNVKCLISANLKKPDSGKFSSGEHDSLKKIVRKGWNFGGVLFIDVHSLKINFQNHQSIDQLKSYFEAGIDLVLKPKNFFSTYELILKLIKENEPFRNNAELAVERIFRLKKWLHKHKPAQVHPNRIYKIIEHPNHIGLSIKIAEKGITLFQKSENYPINLEKYKDAYHLIYSDINGLPQIPNYFHNQLSTFFNNIHLFVNPDFPSIKDISSRKSSVVILSIYFVGKSSGQSNAGLNLVNQSIGEFYKKKIPVMAFLFGHPFHIKKLRFIEKTEAVFLTYSDVEASQQAAFKALTGSIDIQGKLPVRLATS